MIDIFRKQWQWGALTLGLLVPGLLWLALPGLVLADIEKKQSGLPCG